jgi:hypothetical protein
MRSYSLSKFRIPRSVWPQKSYVDEWERFMDSQSVGGTAETVLGIVGNVKRRRIIIVN